VVLADQDELILVHHRFYPRKGSTDSYTFDYNFLPYHKIREVKLIPLNNPERGLTISCGREEFTFPIAPDLPGLSPLLDSFS